MAISKNTNQKQTMRKYKHSTNELRRQRTRTLVQAGGLLNKAGLLTSFGIKPGDDLQQDDSLQDNIATLFGALLELQSMVHQNDHSTILWKQRGKRGLSQ
jgi:hypothetical protein